jgi:hypothetical protein
MGKILKETIFEVVNELLELSAFELEYRHRAKSNPFSEKWLNCTRTRARLTKLKNYLYEKIKILLVSEYRKDFYNVALFSFLKVTFEDLMDDFKQNIEMKQMELLYRKLYYRLTPDDLFILLTNLITWEHMKYPAILEYTLLENGTEVDNFDFLIYYTRFLDVLSSSEIVSVFDLDALKNTIAKDVIIITTKSVDKLHIFKDWSGLSLVTFKTRFPNFKENLLKKSVHIPPISNEH